LFLGTILAIARQNSKGSIFSIKELNKIVNWPLIANIDFLNSKDFKDYIDSISEKYKKSNKKLIIYPIRPLKIEQKNMLIDILKEGNFNNLEFQENFKNLKKYTDILLLINLGVTTSEDVIILKRKLALLDIEIFGCITINEEMKIKL